MAQTLCSQVLWEKIGIGIRWFSPLKITNEIVSADTFPMPAYLARMHAVRSEMTDTLHNQDGEPFHAIMGPGSAKALTESLLTRFNLDGVDPADGKVGLLDPYQIWAFMVDPYRKLLKPQIVLRGGGDEFGLAYQLNEVLKFFVAGTDDEARATRMPLRTEFLQMHGQTGKCMSCYEDPPPTQLPYAESIVLEKTLQIKEVVKWSKTYGCPDGCLVFFDIIPKTMFHKLIIMPLLSIRGTGSTGSTSVESVAKPLKHRVASGGHDRIAVER